MSGRGGRAPSGPWSRLRPVTVDPLEAYGLPSRGDNRLLDLRTQERYYTKIVDRYMSFCSNTGRGDELLRRFASLNLHAANSSSSTTSLSSTAAIPSTTTSNSASTSTGTANLPLTSSSSPPSTDYQDHKDLTLLLLSMRKLREALVATHRTDPFAQQAYIFCIRLSILLRHLESYHPALLYLLRVLHVAQPLSPTDLHEFTSYLVLDLACRQGDLAGAFAARRAYGLKDAKVNAALRALAHDDYELFWRVKRSVDGHKAKLMEWAEEGVRMQALKCLGRTYFTVDVEFVERVTGKRWEELVSGEGVGWELQGQKVVVRKPKGR